MNITRIDVSDFRAFSSPVSFDLGPGKNLLLFGTNGAGKSSLFRAIRECFNIHSVEPYDANRNIFRTPAGTAGYVRLHFSDGAPPAEWVYGGARPVVDQRVAQGALRIGCLNYYALLDTNYAFKDRGVNLFGVLVKGILRPWLLDIVDPANPRKLTLGTLWDRTFTSRIPRPGRRSAARVQAAIDAAKVFNDTFRAHYNRLEVRANDLLAKLSGSTLAITLQFHGIVYDRDRRDYVNQDIGLNVTLNGIPIPNPQGFLNEARLTAIALSLYLASLLESVPDDPNWPRLLVCDDILIGLDMSHRMPLLDILHDEFKNWQVFLFTHDRAWFELAQIATSEYDTWCYYEMTAKAQQEGAVVFEAPQVHPPTNDLARHHIARARTFAGVDDRTAAFHTRAAFEVKLKSYCHKKRVHLAYDLDGRHLNTDDFLDAIERRLTWSGKLPLALFYLQRARLFRRGVLNPYAHFQPVTISPNEVLMAIATIESLSFTDDRTDYAKKAHACLAGVCATQEDRIAAGCWLRTSFEVDLRAALIRFGGRVAYRDDWTKLGHIELWNSAKLALAGANAQAAVVLTTNIEAHRKVFLDEWTFASVSAITKGELDAAWNILRDPGVAMPKTRLETFA